MQSDMDKIGTMTKIDRYKWTIKDKPGEQTILNKSSLIVDETYQRIARKQKVLTIASNWSWIACGVIKVVERGGRFYIVDGQHRVAAAHKRTDIASLPCIVFDGNDQLPYEAQGFYDSNVSISVPSSVDKFKPLVVMNNPQALLINRLAKSSGRIITQEAGPGTISCVRSLLKWAASHPDTLEDLWPMMCEFFDGETFHNNLVDAFMYIELRIHPNDTIATGKWRQRILKLGYKSLLEGAHKAAAFYAAGGAKVWASGVILTLNKGLRNKLPEI
jgi:hypothetical protein